MSSQRVRTLALVLACMVVVGALRVLPRRLGGATTEAVKQTRAEIAKRLATAADSPSVDGWIEAHAAKYATTVATKESEIRQSLTFKGEDGREHPYLADYDSYLWLHLARQYVRRGTICDEVVDGVCRETLTHAPVGREMLYGTSLHTATIVALHKLITIFSPGFPISTTAYYVPVLIGVLGVIPAFFLGLTFGGPPGAIAAAFISGANPAYLIRSLGSDNDVWNVVLPIYAVWAAVGALRADNRSRSLVYSSLAGVVIAMQAATWNGWPYAHSILAVGLSVTLAFTVGRVAWKGRNWRVWTDPSVARVASVLATYFVVAGVTVTAVGPDVGFATTNLRIFGEIGGTTAELIGRPEQYAIDEERALWPEEFGTVSEMLTLRDNNIMSFTTNVPLMFASFFGVVLLVLGPRPWKPMNWGFFAVAAAVVAYASVNAPRGSIAAGALVFAPALAAAVGAIPGDRRRDDLERGGIVILMWLAIAFVFGTRANRFVMLLAPPVGVAVGALARWIYSVITELLAPRIGRQPALAAAWGAIAVLLAAPAYRGYVTARDFLPQINDAWWDSLTAIRDESPPNAIIHLWWHDGYWGKYVTERPVIADGASLRSHINYWFRYALLQPDDARAARLLRMIGCGSDALPYPEGALGAYGKLRNQGLSVLAARDLVDRVAGMSRGEAETLLVAQGVPPAAAADVLRSTHCEPPPMYLVLGTDLATTAGWGNGAWDFRRAYVARRALDLPRDEALNQVTGLGYTAGEARQLFRLAEQARASNRVRDFIRAELGFLTKSWIDCAPDPRAGFIDCRLASKVSGGQQVVEAIEYSDAVPAGARLRVRKTGRDGKPSYSFRTPGTVFIAGATEFRRIPIPGATDPGIALLIDQPGRRLLMAEAILLGSTFTKLVFLEGRYLTHFEKISVRDSKRGDRVFSYRVLP